MPDVPALVQRAVLGVLSHIPATREVHRTNPVTHSRAIAKAAARKAATVSGSLSLPPGPLGWLTIIPDLTMVWKIQSQMVADIAGAFGKTRFLGREQMLYCLFRHAAAQTVRRFAVRAGERVIIRRAGPFALETAARKIGVPLAKRLAGRGLSRWLPVVGAAGVAGFAYYDTMRVAATTIELFRSEIVDVTDTEVVTVSDLGGTADASVASEPEGRTDAPRLELENPHRGDGVTPAAAEVAHVGTDLRRAAAKIPILEDPDAAAEDANGGDPIVKTPRQ